MIGLSIRQALTREREQGFDDELPPPVDVPPIGAIAALLGITSSVQLSSRTSFRPMSSRSR